MIAVVIGGRHSIRALADYVLHDQATAADPRPVSSERVEWTACLGVPMTDPQLMVRCMQGLAADAAILKSLAGVPASGRKLSNPYEHVVLSWPEGTKPPSRAHALDTVQGALDALGLDDRHRGIVVAHADTDSPHVHVLVSRVCPETGRAVKVTKPAVRRLQRWAVDYERRTGGVVIENRVRRQQARAAFTTEVTALKAAGVPEKDAVDVARENNPLPPQRPRSERRSAGREKRTATERAEWRELSERQREQPDLHPGQAKTERVQLAQRQTRRRQRQKVFAPLTKLKLWQPAPDTTPGRREPAPKAATARIPGPDLQRLEAQIGSKRDPDPRRAARRRGGPCARPSATPRASNARPPPRARPASARPARRSRSPSVTTGPPGAPCGPPPATTPRPAMPSPPPPARRPAGRPAASAEASSTSRTWTPTNTATRPATPSSSPTAKPGGEPATGRRRATAGAPRRPTSAGPGMTAVGRRVRTARHVAGCSGSGSVWRI